MRNALLHMQPIMLRGAGLIGSQVAEKLARKNVPVIIISRNPSRFKTREGFTVIDRADTLAQVTALEQVSAVINLEGKSIAAGIWTKKLKHEILKSRIESVSHLQSLVRKANNPNLKILQASATGYYGDRGSEIMTEAKEPGTGYLSDTCVEWESAAIKAFKADQLATFRISPVLSNEAGVFTVWRRVFRAFLGGRFGSGEQYFSWIHEHDMAELLVHYALNFKPGVVNATAPEPVKNAYLTEVLAAQFKRSAIMHVPQFILSLMPGDFGREMLLASVRAVPKKALADGFEFRFQKFDEAVADLA